MCVRVRVPAVAAAEGQGPGRRAVVLVKDRAAAAADALEAMGGGLHLQSLAIEFELQPLGGEPPVRVRLPLHLGPGGVLNKPTTVRLTCTLPTDAGLCPDMTVRLYEEMASGMLGSRAPSVLMATGTLPLRAALEAAHPADVRHRLANMKEVGTVIVAAMALHNAAKTRGGLGGRSLAHMNSRSADDTGKASHCPYRARLFCDPPCKLHASLPRAFPSNSPRASPPNLSRLSALRSSSAARKPGFLSRVLAPRARAKSAQRGSRAQEGASPTSESGKAPESGRRGSQTGEADGSRTARAQSVPPAIANPVDRLVRFGSTAKLPPLEPAETKPALQRKSSEILTMGSLGGQLGSALSSRKVKIKKIEHKYFFRVALSALASILTA
ncbi:hypothetical protein T492DRAFT_1117646 [Pavlovales sp. CCMP2436]|nr:hypothetical protein T492DRAFT_1117646 [Pavlovales sp. CCMP2436]